MQHRSHLEEFMLPVIGDSGANAAMPDVNATSQDETESLSEPATLSRMTPQILLAKGKRVAGSIISLSYTQPAVKSAAMCLLGRQIGDSSMLYYDLTISNLIGSAIMEEPALRFEIQDAIEEMMAFLEQHRYPQRNHHSSMFFQGAD